MTTSSSPDVFALMDAYKLLGVEYSADSGEIRRAHRRLARDHHPDKFPSGSPEQQRATARMAEINAAYALVTDAPLRYHRVSQAADPDTAWTDEELQAAIRRAKASRRFDIGMMAALVLVSLIVFPLVLRTLVPVAVPRPARGAVFMVISALTSLAMWTTLSRRTWHAIFKIGLALAILRLLTTNWKSFF